MREKKIHGDIAVKVIELRLSGMSEAEIANELKRLGLANVSQPTIHRFLAEEFPQELTLRLARKQLAINTSRHAFLTDVFFKAITTKMDDILEMLQKGQPLGFDDLYRLERFIRRHGEEIERLARISGAIPEQKTEINITIVEKLINEVYNVITRYVPKEKQKDFAERIRKAFLAGFDGEIEGRYSLNPN